MTASKTFIELFGGNKLTAQVHILNILQGQDPTKNINLCEKELKKVGYQDE